MAVLFAGRVEVQLDYCTLVNIVPEDYFGYVYIWCLKQLTWTPKSAREGKDNPQTFFLVV